MNKLTEVMNKILSFFCISLSSVLVLSVSWQVISRYLLNNPSTFTDETSRFLFIWVGLMGAAYTLGQKRHLAIDLLLTKLEKSPVKLNSLHIVLNLLSLFFVCAIMMYGGGNLMLKSLATGQISPALGIEMGWVYSAIPLSGFFMVIYLIREFCELISVRKNLAQLTLLPNTKA